MNQLIIVATLSISSVSGFHMPHPLLAEHLTATLLKGPPAFEEALFDDKAMLTPDGDVSWVTVPLKSNNFWIADGGALDIIRNIALGITGLLFFLAGVTFLYASFILPQAAQELEKECKELDPALWDEYKAKLKEGETMATRPDLMQELGMKLQPLLDAKVAALEEEKEDEGKGVLPTALETTMNPLGSDPANKEDDGPEITLTTTDQWDNDDKPKK